MKTHRQKLGWRRSLVLATLAIAAGGCVDAFVGEVDVCKYEGKGYSANEKFPAGDGCNTCACQIDGDVACTELACDSDGANGDGTDGGTSSGGGFKDAGTPSTVPAPGKDAGLVNNPNAPGGTCDLSGKILKVGEKVDLNCSICTCIKTGWAECTVDSSCQVSTGAPCTDGFKMYAPGDSYPASDGCNKCTCEKDGTASCTLQACAPTPADGSCIIDRKFYPEGASFVAPDGCNTCYCKGGVAACTERGCTQPPPAMGTCSFEGKQYAVGQGFERGDGCNKCSCVSDGLVECSQHSCLPIPGCSLGFDRIQPGTTLPCEDGCNICTCDMQSQWSMTKRACPPLPAIAPCPNAPGPLSFPAQFVYQANDVLAVNESRCVSGHSSDFGLCFEELGTAANSPSSVGIYAVPTGTTRTCDPAVEVRVFDLKPLRTAYVTAFGMSQGKIVLDGDFSSVVYQFGP